MTARDKEIAMTIIEVIIAEPTTNSWGIDSNVIEHIVKGREFFVDFKEKAVKEHKV
jgi:hypothetical protein